MSRDRSDARIIGGVKRYPVDQVARRVTSEGVNFEPKSLPNSVGGVTWTTPPATVPVPPKVPDLRGTRRGAMQIVGYLVKRSDRDDSRKNVWLAKCDCGRYEPRIGKTWRRGLDAGSHDLCRYCLRLAQDRHANLPLAERRRTTAVPGPVKDERHTQRTVRSWRAPPPVKPHPRLDEWLGKRRGNLTVFGYFGNENNHPKWVVKCDCGLYEIRKERTLRRPARAIDMCNACSGEIKERNSAAWREGQASA